MVSKPTYEELDQRVKELEKIALGRKRAGEALNQKEQEKRAILDSLLEHVVYQDTEHRVLWANEAACESVGMTREDLIGRRCYEVWAGRESTCEDCPVAKARDTGKPQTVEKMTPDGRWWYVQGYPVRDDRGHIVGMTELTLDITDRKKVEVALRAARDGLEQRVKERTSELLSRNEQLTLEIEERKRTEEALRESEAKYSTLVENSLTGIFIHQDGKYMFVNDRFADIHGYQPEELLGQDPMTLIHPDERKGLKQVLSKRLKGESVPNQYVVRRLRKDGETIWCEMMATRIEYARRPAVMGNVIDIMQRKQAEDQIRALSHQLLKAQEMERQRLAYDLHDHLAQDLSALKIAFDTFCDRHQEISTGARQRMSELSKKLHGVILAVRDLAYDLRPPGLDEAGLVDALDDYCEEYSSKSDLEVEFLPVGIDESELDFDSKITLYRLVQEALSNVRKHADASHVSIRLVASFPNIILRIEDDGRGFDVAARLAAAHYEKRMGLVGMKERVALLGGTMEIQSRPAEGTKIVVEVPYGGKYHGK